MDTKVMSVRIPIELFERITELSERLYGNSFQLSSNRTSFHTDALRFFCDLAETGYLDNKNLSNIDINHIVSKTPNFDNNAVQNIQASLVRIETKLDIDKDSSVYSVNNTSSDAEIEPKIYNLTQAWEHARAEGYLFSKSTFRNQFNDGSETESLVYNGFKRVKHSTKKGFAYQLVES